MSQFQSDAIFWVEVEKVRPNPYQPRTEFDEARLKDLSESIRQYGVLQPMTVTRHEETKEDGGIATYYELIAGERRLRASRMAGLSQVPVIIRSAEENERTKLEIAIIENLQREDLNAIDRARAFERLAKEFNLNNVEIGKKVGKSREYVSNSLRLLSLPDEIQGALKAGLIYEGHARALLMLEDRKEEMMTLFRDIQTRKLSVREVEKLTREIAWDRARKKEAKPEIQAMEKALAESLGTQVEIREDAKGGKLIINFFSPEDLEAILARVSNAPEVGKTENSLSVPEEIQAPAPLPKEDDDTFSVDKFSI
jgi:ParB family chromosome partitioning protein